MPIRKSRQFRIWHLLMLLAAVAMGGSLIRLDSTLASLVGTVLLTGAGGNVISYAFFSISDLIDRRPLNDRGLFSRLINFLGLVCLGLTFCLVLVLTSFVVFYFGVLLVEAVVPDIKSRIE
jgi:hypothetical protein